ncbi:MAG: ribonuclease HI [Clostridia bacterium]|nr:ribonuclease HI [Clostridia bacterium]
MEEKVKNVKIYTDGACSGNPGPGGYAAILIYKGIEKEISGGELNTTNNKMEITAVVKGLELLKEACDVTVYSDSAYVVNSVEKGWLYSWKKNNWIKADKERVKNIELWEEMLALLETHNVRFVKVKGHSDNTYNNRCDELAVQERDKFLL